MSWLSRISNIFSPTTTPNTPIPQNVRNQERKLDQLDDLIQRMEIWDDWDESNFDSLNKKFQQISTILSKASNENKTRFLISSNDLNFIKFLGVQGLKSNYEKLEQSFFKLGAQSSERIIFFLPFLPNKVQIQFFDRLTVFLGESITHVQFCQQHQIMEKCIDYLSLYQELETPFDVVSRISLIIGTLGSFSVNGSQLTILLRLIVSGHQFSPKEFHRMHMKAEISALTLGILGRMAQITNPSCFFNFDGERSAINLIEPQENFTLPKNGFTFCTWIRFETISNSQFSRIFAASDKRNGFELIIKSNQVWVRTISNGKGELFSFNNDFIPIHRWTFLSFTKQKNSFFSNCELQLYINEKRYTCEIKKFPSLSSGVTFVQIGGNSSPNPSNSSQNSVQPFKGQLGSIAFFQNCLSENDIKILYDLGSDFKFQFKTVDLREFQREIGIDAQFSNPDLIQKSLSLLYIPRAAGPNPSILLDNSSKGINAYSTTTVYISKHLTDTLQCVGGIEILFPLIQSLMEDDLPVEEGVCVSILALIYKSLQNSLSCQEDVERKKSLSTLGHLMTRVHRKHLTIGTLRQFFAFSKLFSPSQENYKVLFRDLILNFKIWERAPFSVQSELLRLVLEEVEKYPEIFSKGLGIQFLLDISHKHFSFSKENFEENKKIILFSNEKNNDNELSEEETLHLRTQLFQILSNMLSYNDKNGLEKRDIKPFFMFLIECQDKKQICITLRWLLQTLDQVQNFTSIMIDISFPAIFKCLSTSHITSKILFIKLISSLLEHEKKEKRQILSNKGYFYALFEYIQEIDMVTYCSLFEMMTLQTSSMISQDLKAKERHVIALEDVLDSLLITIPKLNSKIGNKFLEDIFILCNNPKNTTIITQIPFWHNKLLQVFESSGGEFDIVSLISKIISNSFGIRGTYTQLNDTLTFIKIYCVERGKNEEILLKLLESMLEFISKEVMKGEPKDHPIWENFFHYCQLVEETTMWNLGLPIDNRVKFAFNFIKSQDDLVRKCTTDKNLMECVHIPFSKKKGFTLRNIIDVAQEVAGLSQKNVSNLEPTIFVSMFRIHLFLLENLSKDLIKKENQIIRMLALCCLDIQDPQVPALTYTATDIGIDTEVNHQRMFYILGHSLHSIEKGNKEVINFVRPVISKYKDYLSTILTNIDARQYLNFQLNPSYLKRKEKKSTFKLIYDTEWKIVRNSAPLSLAIEEAEKDVINTMTVFKERNAKQYEQALKDVLENNQKIGILMRNVVKELSEEFSNLAWKEKQRYESWENALRRNNTLLENNWKDTMNDFYFGVGVWKLNNLPSFEKVDLSETYKDRQRSRIVLNPKGTRHSTSSQIISEHQKDKIDNEIEFPTTPLTDTSIFNFNVVAMEDKTESDVTEKEEILSPEIEEYVIVENREEKKLKREKYDITLNVYDVELILPLLSIRGKLEMTRSNLFFSIDDEYEDNPSKSEWKNYEKQWSLKIIEKIYRRRYLLSHTAVEIFLLDRTTVYFNFIINKENEAFVNQLLKLRLPNLILNAFPYTPQQLFKKSPMIEKWKRGEISNFEYLMHLNTLANRTYNDLTQYFVMPWVIKDYTSETIDLNDPNIYRDLSKPIGALNPSRLEEIIERYESFSDPVIPSFHYGSHYSSCGTVLYYLIRIEPFTEQNIKLQGGTFDLADRLFHSIATTWHVVNVSTSDVKELVPEFFYLPEAFKNNNKLLLGVRQDGIELGDVILPPWASSPEEFVRIQRQALESEYVSRNLHKWIDLIFGYKQRGSEAKKAYNLFYYLTYEGSVDLSMIEDPMLKKSIITQLKNFGQTPSQLLKKPHPEKYPSQSFIRPPYWVEPNLTFNPFFSFKMGEDQKVPISHVSYIHSIGKIIAIDLNRKLQIIQPLKQKAITTLAQPIGVSYAKDIMIHSRLFICLKDRWVISCGHYDRSIKCTALFDKKEVKQCYYDHKDIVTCLAVCEHGNSVVTGSLDCTVRIWKANTAASQNPLKMQCVLYGHNDSIYSVDVNDNLDLVVSVSTNGKCLLHRLYNGKFIRKINLPEKVPIHLVRIAPNGNILIFSKNDKMLYNYNQNGVKLCWSKLDEDINDMKIDSLSQYIFTGGSRGQLVVRKLSDLMEMKRYTVLGSEIHCVDIKKLSQKAYEVIVGCYGQQICFFSWNEDENM